MSLRQLAPRRSKRTVDPVDAAFERFYQEHVAEVYQYALAVLTNPADAEDVTQATFLNAYRAFKRGERPRIPHNWLIKIAHNVCRMRWRQAKRRPQEVPFEEFHEPIVVDEDKPNVKDVLRALSILPFNQRAALVMREVEGRSYNEIAEILGATVPAVEALLFRARQKLRLRRRTIGVLSTAPLPTSLSTFFGGGSVVGGSLLASSVALKTAAVVATGLVAGGLGFKTVRADADADSAMPPAAFAAYPNGPARIWADPVRRLVRAQRRANASAQRSAGRNIVRRGARPVDETTAEPNAPMIHGYHYSTAPQPSNSPVQTVAPTLPVKVPQTPVGTPNAPSVPAPPVALPVSVHVPPLPVPPLHK